MVATGESVTTAAPNKPHNPLREHLERTKEQNATPATPPSRPTQAKRTKPKGNQLDAVEIKEGMTVAQLASSLKMKPRAVVSRALANIYEMKREFNNDNPLTKDSVLTLEQCELIVLEYDLDYDILPGWVSHIYLHHAHDLTGYRNTGSHSIIVRNEVHIF